MSDTTNTSTRPLVIVTGSAGDIGSSLILTLTGKYQVIGMDREETPLADHNYTLDLTSPDDVKKTFDAFREKFGRHIAAVFHLAAYFDFTGEDSPLYEEVNVNGARNLMAALQNFYVERFIYSSTMLVHRASEPDGAPITEDTPLDPDWVYPEYKTKAEIIIKENAGAMPYSILRLAGLYDDKQAAPVLSQQIARIYEKDLESHLYPGDTDAGQAYVHRQDLMQAFLKTLQRRRDLPRENIMLIGEDRAVGYGELQDRIGELIHGKEHWRTLRVPKPVAKAGAWVEEKAEPIIPNSIDKGEKPFIKPFMVDMSSDHYELDVSRAADLLDWKPRHALYDDLEKLIANLKKDPQGWYKANDVTLPESLKAS
ncbi:NAD(P)-dependent oxidoreductase [Hahella sp. CR1]|uniref:NAD-dependent epimerase/dehydratase family protein n=1 Tax=Hahella sp. CR1 TaxID=2992807 RepID=UPI002441E5D3|nr:NAD(P)-dependent oxidoreductase [Hahella sp. CR1]MDG9669350.1 NAD(P)-dependent oxidoreductase [Hahella sp. CR1]